MSLLQLLKLPTGLRLVGFDAFAPGFMQRDLFQPRPRIYFSV